MIKAYAKSDVGKVRENNQDSYYITESPFDEMQLFILADGMGGNMFIIVGLGNPEKKYENTRHNIGFAVIDQLAREEHIPVLEKKHRALIGKGYIGGEKVILAKPQTYMNLSGESVRELVDYYKIDETKELLVISDDITLPAGQLRLKKRECRRT